MSDVFKIPESEVDKPENRYRFDLGGVEIDVPLLSHVDGRALAILDRNVYTDVEADGVTYDFFAHLAGDEHGDKIRGLDRKQLDALASAYRKASGITEGESEASSSS